MKKGLEPKYLVQKINGKTDPEADYFVLRLDKDKHALKAIKAYAESVQGENMELAFDLLKKVKKYQFEGINLKTVREDMEGKTYKHRNGIEYEVLKVTNILENGDINFNHLPDVVYIGKNQKIWSRPLSEFGRSFTLVKTE